MSWGEIKHALNGTLGTSDFKPLDKIIDNGITEIKTPGAVSIVKSVQRGTAHEDDETSEISITISTVNPSKCMVLLDNGNVNYEGSAGDNLPGSRVVSLTSNRLTITNQYIRYDFSTDGIGWQVIEFY